MATRELITGTSGKDTITRASTTLPTGVVGYNIEGLGDDDTLTGSTGSDSISGGTGADSMTGLAGNDIYVVDHTGDVAVEAADNGTDTVQSSISYTLGAELENLILTGSSAINGTGNTKKNVIRGNSGNNVLEGGQNTNLGDADTLVGGLGNDVYIVRNQGDVVSEAVGAGTDEVQSYLGYILGSHVENLTLLGDAEISATGNNLNNTITGNSATNTLEGMGGNDTYVVNLVDASGVMQDTVQEQANAGTDTVRLSGTSSNSNVANLALFENVENLDASATANSKLNLQGNALNNILTGNDADNRIDGDKGKDTMRGGKGDDTYVVDTVGETVTELADAGTDTVEASVSYTLSNHVENLTLTGTGNLKATGNTLANVLMGNDGANVLDGKAGADVMKGGAGNDTYVVDNSADQVEETTTTGETTIDSGGIDLVQASVNHSLSTHVENLTLTGTLAIHGTGNAEANRLLGNTAANNLTGDAGNDTLDGGKGVDALVGGTGDDTYIVDLVSTATTTSLQDTITEDADADAGDDTLQLRGSYTGTSVVTFSLATDSALANLEHLDASGTASSRLNLTGNASTNKLTGNGAANRLDGGAGADTMQGRGGNDTYVVDDTGDVVNETVAGSTGIDTVEAAVNYTLGTGVEHLILKGTASTGAGNAQANQITGNSSANTLTGYQGNDTLDGGEGTETDILIGGIGNDVYHIRRSGDTVTEETGTINGSDTAIVHVENYTLAANVEKMVLADPVANGTGNDLANTITGNAANNVLDGGLGNDVMVGGLGNDTYIVAQTGDSITEKSNEGTDTVLASVTYSLAARANVENLTLVEGSTALKGTGNSLANQITGNEGNNTLDGYKNSTTVADGDSLTGGAGDDVYIVRNASDVVTETEGAGTDEIKAYALAADYVLADHVENLTLMSTTLITANGNTLNNLLKGNSAANTLNGNGGNDTLDGGTGADALNGGAGDDVYVVDNAGDSVTETVDAGTDTVQASVAYTLGDNVEHLVLTKTSGVAGTGNTAANTLTGNSGANTLDGKAGMDVLTGGRGADTFRFSTALGADNVDVIDDFSAAEGDKVSLDKAIFTALINTSTSALLAAQFGVMDSLIDPITGTEGQAILYDVNTGKLYYDSNGATDDGLTLFATLTGVPALSAANFVVTV